MAIYNIFDYKESTAKMQQPDLFGQTYNEYLTSEGKITPSVTSKGQFFSAIAARFFFFILLLADLLWSVYSIALITIKTTFCLLSFFQLAPLRESLAKSWLSFKRSLVCAIALFVAIFAPALGIMFSCMYFLMYDKDGVEEVVPESLRDQFKDFLPSDWF